MEFGSITAYLEALESDPSLAAIPVQMAADALGVSHAAISAQMRNGKVEAVKIGRTRLVRAQSISGRLFDYDSDVAEVRSFLEGIAAAGVTTTYTPTMKVIDRSPTIPNDRSYIGKVLGDVSRVTFERHGFLLSALVYNTSLRRPSDSFYALAEEIDDEYRDIETDAEYLQLQLRKIYSHYG